MGRIKIDGSIFFNFFLNVWNIWIFAEDRPRIFEHNCSSGFAALIYAISINSADNTSQIYGIEHSFRLWKNKHLKKHYSCYFSYWNLLCRVVSCQSLGYDVGSALVHVHWSPIPRRSGCPSARLPSLRAGGSTQRRLHLVWSEFLQNRRIGLFDSER